ncbi:hypothetical protein TNCV_2009231 [Trichonephila clavipes]|nr:hypothetical protein TNCV_2009231 [Trichonephila clavipes]
MHRLKSFNVANKVKQLKDIPIYIPVMHWVVCTLFIRTIQIAVDQYTWTNILSRFKNRSTVSCALLIAKLRKELNLLENDAHWDTALADASNTARPRANTHAICHNINNLIPI